MCRIKNKTGRKKKYCKQLKSYLNRLHSIYIDERRFQFSGWFVGLNWKMFGIFHINSNTFHQFKMNSHCHGIRVHNSPLIEFNIQVFWYLWAYSKFEHLNRYENRIDFNSQNEWKCTKNAWIIINNYCWCSEGYRMYNADADAVLKITNWK